MLPGLMELPSITGGQGGISAPSSANATSSATVSNSFTTGAFNVGAGAGSGILPAVILAAAVLAYIWFSNRGK